MAPGDIACVVRGDTECSGCFTWGPVVAFRVETDCAEEVRVCLCLPCLARLTQQLQACVPLDIAQAPAVRSQSIQVRTLSGE